MKESLDENSRLKPGQTYDLAWAVQSLGEALAEDRTLYCISRVNKTIRHLNEFIGNVSPAPDLTEAEANVARALHTYMRKYMDSHLSVILYRLIDENRGLPIWYAFVKGLVADKGDVRGAMQAVNVAKRSHGTTDDIFMESALNMWRDDFKKDKVWEFINE